MELIILSANRHDNLSIFIVCENSNIVVYDSSLKIFLLYFEMCFFLNYVILSPRKHFINQICSCVQLRLPYFLVYYFVLLYFHYTYIAVRFHIIFVIYKFCDSNQALYLSVLQIFHLLRENNTCLAQNGQNKSNENICEVPINCV